MVTMRGITTQRGIRWYGEHAKADVALVIVESTPVARFVDCPCDAARLTTESLKPLADAIHSGGAIAVIQLFPSCSLVPENADPLTVSTSALKDLVRSFGIASKICTDAGFDGVEPHGAHGFLLCKLAHKTSNTRTDEFGIPGRLSSEIIKAIRENCPPETLVLYRYSLAGGCGGEGKGCSEADAQEAAWFSKVLLEAGCDILDVSPGGCSAMPARVTAAVKAFGCRLPTISVGGMDNPANARSAIREGKTDLVAIGRGLIADPLWASKIKSGKESEIVRCIRCNMGCMNNLQHRQPIGCLRWESSNLF